MPIHKPLSSDAPAYCLPFFDLVKGGDLIQALEESCDQTLQLLQSIPAEKAHFAYASGKWTLAEVMRHIIDCERVYAYRIFRFSRLDPTELAGFDENVYIDQMKEIRYELTVLSAEYESLRNSTLHLLRPLTDDRLDFKGRANGVIFTPRALGYMAVGHNLHHIEVIRKKYLEEHRS